MEGLSNLINDHVIMRVSTLLNPRKFPECGEVCHVGQKPDWSQSLQLDWHFREKISQLAITTNHCNPPLSFTLAASGGEAVFA